MYILQRNGSETYDGVFNMLTGSKNLENIGILQEWDHRKKSDIYPGTCNVINGTLGDLLPPPADSDTIPIFAPDMCTLIHLKYNNNIDYGGLSGKRFISTAEMFDNGTKVQSRACYCADVECQPSGTLNVSICKYGAPAFMSLPHFYLADESYRNSIVGMKPDKAKHEFSLAVQTVSYYSYYYFTMVFDELINIYILKNCFNLGFWITTASTRTFTVKFTTTTNRKNWVYKHF